MKSDLPRECQLLPGSVSTYRYLLSGVIPIRTMWRQVADSKVQLQESNSDGMDGWGKGGQALKSSRILES